MVTVCLTGDGEFLAELNLGFVPRVGERVSYEGLWRVTEVTWELHGDGTVAQVALEQIMGPAKR